MEPHMSEHEVRQRCLQHEKLIRDIHLAVCGDEELGVAGLVAEVKQLKEWRRTMEIRIAKITGICVVLGLLAEKLLNIII